MGQRHLDPGAWPLRFGDAAMAFHKPRRVGPTMSALSGLTPVAYAPAVYASQAASRRTTQDSLSAAILDLTEAGLSPAGRYERFLFAT